MAELGTHYYPLGIHYEAERNLPNVQQGSQTVSAYITSFEKIADDTRWTEEMKIIFFLRGLNRFYE